MNLQEAFDAGFEAVKQYVDDGFATLEARIAAVEKAAPQPEPLPDISALIRQEVAEAVATIEIPVPQDGKSVTVDDCRPMIEEAAERAATEAVRAIPAAKDGVSFTDAVIDRKGALVFTKSNGSTVTLGRVVGRSVSADEVRAMVSAAVEKAVADIPPAEPGRDADMDAVFARVEQEVGKAAGAIPVLVSEAVKALPPPEPGRDADPEAVAERVREMIATDLAEVTKAVNSIPDVPELPDIPGMVEKSTQPVRDAVAEVLARVTPEALAKAAAEAAVGVDRISEMVGKAVAALPPAEPGKSVTVDDVRPMLAELVEAEVRALPPPKPGEPGPVGKLPMVKAWVDTVHREGEVVTHDGATYQAARDTGKAPPHADWICLAAAGRPGKDADEIEVIGTYDAERSYKRLNIVALNGGSFQARKDEPGPCPGEGWQVIAMRGKPGQPGEPGKRGEPGLRGLPGPGVVKFDRDDQGLLTLTNGDGTTVECDLYDLLAKVAK